MDFVRSCVRSCAPWAYAPRAGAARRRWAGRKRVRARKLVLCEPRKEPPTPRARAGEAGVWARQARQMREEELVFIGMKEPDPKPRDKDPVRRQEDVRARRRIVQVPWPAFDYCLPSV
jgi:hypothetical protein